MSRPLGDVPLAALMLDGIELKGINGVASSRWASAPTESGFRWGWGNGSTENKTVTVHLLSDLVARGLGVEQGVLVVLDGSKALKAAAEVFGPVPV